MRNELFWTPHDIHALPLARSFSELTAIALSVLQRMPEPVGQVCGPISSGGLGSIEANLAVFDAAIGLLVADGKVVFDQMPFEEHFFRIIRNGWSTRTNNTLLVDFYQPLFETGSIRTLYFLHGWETSGGAMWERAFGKKLGMEIIDLPPDFASVGTKDS